MANPAPNAETQAEVGHEAGGHANFPPFDSSTFPSQLLWFALIFGGMYYYLSKRFLPAVGGVIQSRRAHIAKDIDEATELQRKADAAAASACCCIRVASSRSLAMRARRASITSPTFGRKRFDK